MGREQILLGSSSDFEIFNRNSTQRSPDSDSGLIHRRHRVAEVFSHVFPTEVTIYNNALEEARQMRENGYSFIIPYSHSEMRDPVDAIRTVIDFGRKFDNAEYTGPVAYHQNTFYMKALASLIEMNAVPIVTANTIEKGKNLEPTPFKIKIEDLFSSAIHQLPGTSTKLPLPRKELKARESLREYIHEAAVTLANQGIVFIAPQGGRNPELGQPIGRPNEMIINEAQRLGVDMDKVAFWPMGIMAVDKNTGIHNPNHGLRASLGRKANINLGVPITLSELQSDAREQSIEKGRKVNIDQRIFEELAGLLPESYSKVEYSQKMPKSGQSPTSKNSS